MEVPTLFLIKMGVLAGLTLLSYGKCRRLIKQKENHRKHVLASLTEVPGLETAVKSEDDSSTSGCSRVTPSQKDYSSAYQPFLSGSPLQEDN